MTCTVLLPEAHALREGVEIPPREGCGGAPRGNVRGWKYHCNSCGKYCLPQNPVRKGFFNGFGSWTLSCTSFSGVCSKYKIKDVKENH